MVIDFHVHYKNEKGYLENLLKECARLKIDKIVLNSCGGFYGDVDNNTVLNAYRKYPDKVIPFAYFPLGREDAGKVSEYHKKGFKGLKIITPPYNYDDKRFYPVYKKAENAGMVLLFHTGIVARTDRDHEIDVSSDRMRPIFLDTIARAFPRLTIVGAHLGNPWFEEAAMAVRWNTNLYFDITGSTLKRVKPEFIGSLLWWKSTSRYRDPLGRSAWEKIVFGSDVPYNEIGDVMNDYGNVMNKLKVSRHIQNKVFGETAKSILKIIS